MKASDLDRLPLLTACHDHRVEGFLNSRKHLRVALEDLDNLRVRLLDNPDGLQQQLGPSCQARSVVRRPEEGDTTGRAEDVLEVSFRSLFRCGQGLPRSLAQHQASGVVPYILADQPS